ncbi:hypothetical protein JHK87_013302 [Glycine soja]|nr:hypothetical protein JHK87_013302 [Glycine soja]
MAHSPAIIYKPIHNIIIAPEEFDFNRNLESPWNYVELLELQWTRSFTIPSQAHGVFNYLARSNSCDVDTWQILLRVKWK